MTTKQLTTIGNRLMRIAAQADNALADLNTAKARLDNAQAALASIKRGQTEALAQLAELFNEEG